LQEIVECFGSHALQADGALDRAWLRQTVFSDPIRLQQLESILHPRIRAEILARIAACTNSAYVIVDVPLLFEKGYTQLFERILVIDCLPDQQVLRVRQRDGSDDGDEHQRRRAEGGSSMMTAADVTQGIAIVIMGIALLMTAALAYLALMRWLILIVPTIILVGFAFDADMQLRFTVVLLGLLTLLYLPPLVIIGVWRQNSNSRAVELSTVRSPSSAEMANQAFVDDEAGVRSQLAINAARDAHEEQDLEIQARFLEQQGAVSLWSR
jgi:dephospho-CoA kinase